MNLRMCADPPIPRAHSRIGSPEPGRRHAVAVEDRARGERGAARGGSVEEGDGYQPQCGEGQKTEARRLHSFTGVGSKSPRRYNMRNTPLAIADRRLRASE
jgi:hypothetical protein